MSRRHRNGVVMRMRPQQPWPNHASEGGVLVAFGNKTLGLFSGSRDGDRWVFNKEDIMLRVCVSWLVEVFDASTL